MSSQRLLAAVFFPYKRRDFCIGLAGSQGLFCRDLPGNVNVEMFDLTDLLYWSLRLSAVHHSSNRASRA